MIEKHLIIEDIDPVELYGVGNCHLQIIKSLYPKLRIVARDNVIRVLGDEEEMCRFEENIEKIRSANQQQIVDAFNENDMMFAVGPAGTGKTYLGIALAVKALKEKTAKRIILSRPAVEAGEKLGFLPGDMKEKIDPYLQPLYDALEDMIPAVKLQDMMEKKIIQIAPLAFMRGRTLSDAVVILDEAQNTTSAQIKMFLTRMGWNTKMIITGDMTQVDLPHSVKSGLAVAMDVLKNTEGISIIQLNDKDIVRHKLVTRIVNAFDKYNNERINKD